MSRFDNARDRSPIGRSDGPDAKKGRFDRGPRSRRGPTEKRVYVSNVPYETKWQEVKDLFKEKVGDVAFVELFNDEKGKPRGCGIVEFGDKETAKQAVDVMDKYEINGRKIVVKEDVDADRDRTGRIMKGGGGGDRDRHSFSDRDRSSGYQGPAENNRNLQKNGYDRGLGRMGNSSDPSSKYGNTYGLNVQFLESLGIDGPIVSRIFVANLDYKVDEKKLNEVFKMAGKVAGVDINKDRDGNSRGHGTVEYEHPVEAVQAISMFKDVSLYDRKMSIRMDSAAVREEQLGGVPTKLPVGLKNIGMGLGAGGAPLKNVSSNLPSQSSNSSSSQAPSQGLGALGGANILQNLGVTAALQNQALQSQLSSALGLGSGGLGGGALGSGLGGGSLGSSSGLGSGLGSGIGGAGLGSGLSGLGSGGGLGSGLQQNDRSAYGSSSGGGGGGYNDNRTGRLMDTIVVKNLPPSYSWQSLREKFSNIGEVKFAEMRENGIGVVRFASEKDAERAVNLMDRTRIDNYMVDVYLF